MKATLRVQWGPNFAADMWKHFLLPRGVKEGDAAPDELGLQFHPSIKEIHEYVLPYGRHYLIKLLLFSQTLNYLFKLVEHEQQRKYGNTQKT